MVGKFYAPNLEKCDISSGSTLFVQVKKYLQTNITNFFENYNVIPLDMYNGLYQDC